MKDELLEAILKHYQCKHGFLRLGWDLFNGYPPDFSLCFDNADGLISIDTFTTNHIRISVCPHDPDSMDVLDAFVENVINQVGLITENKRF